MNIDYTKDVKVLGKVVSIAQDNVVADAEQVYDYGFVYGDQTGLDQHTINSLLKNSISNGGSSVSNDSVWNVINGSNKNVAIWNAIKDLQDWRARIDSSPQDIAWLKTQVNNLLQCCETVNSIIGNMPSQGGVVITCNPNPIQMLVGDADRTLSISSSPALAGGYTVTSNNTSVATVLNVSGVYKVHAVGQGNTTITITWGSQTKDVIVTVDLPTYRCYFDLGYTTSEQPPHYQERSHGSLLSKPTDPTRTGYTFNGWHINTSTGSVWNFNTDTITSNITLVAGWTQDQPEQVTVTFNSDGGSAVASQTINKNARATKPADPTKSGYNFVNWFYNGIAFDFNTAITTNMTLIAVWEVSTVYPTDVTIVGPTRVEVGSVGTQYTASITPSNANAYTGVTWSATDGSITQAGIFTAPSTTGNVDITVTTENGRSYIMTVEVYQPSGNVTSVVVTFDSNGGGAVNPSTQTIPSGTTATEPADPVWVGYTFLEWRTVAAVNGYQAGHVWDFSDPVTESMTLQAQWTVDSTPSQVAVSSIQIFGPDQVECSRLVGGVNEGYSTANYVAQLNDGANTGVGVTWTIDGSTQTSENQEQLMQTVGWLAQAGPSSSSALSHSLVYTAPYNQDTTITLRATSENGTTATKTITITTGTPTPTPADYTISWTCVRSGDPTANPRCSINSLVSGSEQVYAGQNWTGNIIQENYLHLTLTDNGVEIPITYPIQINNTQANHTLVLTSSGGEQWITFVGEHASYMDYETSGGTLIDLSQRQDGYSVSMSQDDDEGFIIHPNAGYQITDVTFQWEGTPGTASWNRMGEGDDRINVSIDQPLSNCTVTIHHDGTYQAGGSSSSNQSSSNYTMRLRVDVPTGHAVLNDGSIDLLDTNEVSISQANAPLVYTAVPDTGYDITDISVVRWNSSDGNTIITRFTVSGNTVTIPSNMFVDQDYVTVSITAEPTSN